MAVFRMAVETTLTGMPDKAVNIWHFRAGTAISQAGSPVDEAAFAGAVDAIHTFYGSITGTGTNTAQILAHGAKVNATAAINVETQEAHTVNFAPMTVGGTGGKAPYSMAICINWYSSVASRRGRGRSYLGPLDGYMLDADGTPRDDYLTPLRAAGQRLIDASKASNGWGIGVWGLEQAGGGPKAPHVLRDLVGLKVNDNFAWLHSRNR
jgi:hypothetical protein